MQVWVVSGSEVCVCGKVGEEGMLEYGVKVGCVGAVCGMEYSEMVG